MVNQELALQHIWKTLEQVHDPEIPVLSVVDMRIVRNVEIGEGGVRVEITPTFSGCPAMELIRQEIRDRLREAGFDSVTVEKNVALPWSTDMLSEPVREKLRTFGIAPPPRVEVELKLSAAEIVQCPFCASGDTKLESEFGATLCKQLYYCLSCRQSFERFKSL
ncbi:MAG TPA: 1,2-phenylacetyl-CoA epoxidase subunit PaaD [Bacteroidota bacterium]|nr:1,2-phenylacetyl-CoA epoxidase subunit PaaD [Bacteroidota bacterium]